ncbi:MAG: hypothetical protein Phyf2KO_14010 [Phycisphaerales bacterium]
MKRRWMTAPIVGLALLSGQALAQDEAAAEAQPAAEPELIDAPVIATNYSDEEIAQAAKMLTGVWKTSTSVREFGTNGETDIAMAIGPATVAGLEDVLYVEIARADDTASPYRQALFQLYRYKGEMRLRTYDLRSPQAATALLGMAYTPEVFPKALTAAEFFPTMDIDLKPDGAGFSGSSPAAYPDHRGGAVQMTSSVSFSSDSISISDVGYDVNGEVAWEVGSESPVEFVRADDLVKVDRYSDGLIVTTFRDVTENPVEEGDFIVVDYVAKLTDGTKFDASFDRGEPFRYQYPGGMVQGWLRAVEGMSKGDRLRVFVPSPLAWGNRSIQRVPPNSDIIFDIECVFVEDVEEEVGPTPDSTSDEVDTEGE